MVWDLEDFNPRNECLTEMLSCVALLLASSHLSSTSDCVPQAHWSYWERPVRAVKFILLTATILQCLSKGSFVDEVALDLCFAAS